MDRNLCCLRYLNYGRKKIWKMMFVGDGRPAQYTVNNGSNCLSALFYKKESSPTLGYLFGWLLIRFWILFDTFWRHLGSNWALETCLIFYWCWRYPQILGEQILEGKVWFWAPNHRTQIADKWPQICNLLLHVNRKGNRQQKETRICDQDQFPTSAAWWPLASRGRWIHKGTT